LKDYYQILGVNKNVSSAELKKKYRELAKKYHPDKHKGDSAKEAKFKDISEAYDVLSDTDKRKKYDMEKDNPFFNNFGAGGGHRAQDFGRGGGSFDPFSDIFESFFSGGKNTRSGRSQRQQKSSPKKDMKTTISIPFSLAIKGGDYLFNAPNGKKVKVKVPKSCPEGHEITLKSFGINGESLVVTINILTPDYIQIEELNIIQKISISVFDAILGETREVILYNDKTVKVNIKSGTDSHSKLRLKGLGLEKGLKKGDCFLEIVIETPKSLTDQQKTLVQSLKYNAY
jgi:DnaJ-class molecular chaperone